MSTKMTITAILTKRCTRRCHYCIGSCHDETWSNAPDMDVDALLSWCGKYYPSCNLHLSGGEPLLLDISAIAKRCIDNGHAVSVFTNGDLLTDDHPLLEMPIVWHMTHHLPQTTEEFLKKAELIKDRPHVITRLRVGREALNNTAFEAAKYEGFDFHWSIPNRGRDLSDFCLSESDSGRIASDVMHLIEVDGKVYPCSSKRRHGPIGDIYDGSYDASGLEDLNRHANWCVKNNCCSAYQSAVLLDELGRP